MFYRNNRRHSVSYIASRKINVFFFEYSKLSCVLINNRRKLGLKTCKVGSALCGIDIIAKAEYLFLKFVNILECTFNFYSVPAALIICYIMYCLFVLVKSFYISGYTLFFMESYLFFFTFSCIFKHNSKTGIKICRFMETVFYALSLKFSLFKYCVIR